MTVCALMVGIFQWLFLKVTSLCYEEATRLSLWVNQFIYQFLQTYILIHSRMKQVAVFLSDSLNHLLNQFVQTLIHWGTIFTGGTNIDWQYCVWNVIIFLNGNLYRYIFFLLENLFIAPTRQLHNSAFPQFPKWF